MEHMLVRAIDHNRYELFRVMGEVTGTAVKEHDSFLETRLNPSPWGNYLYRFQLEEDRLSDEIEVIKQKIQSGCLPNQILLSSSDRPVGLVNAFVESGFLQTLSQTGMILEKGQLRYPADSSSFLTIEMVTKESDLGNWVHCVTDCLFHQGCAETRAYLPLFRHLFYLKSCVFLLGKIDALPVSTVFLFQHKAIGGLYFISTRPEYQKRGYGAQMIIQALQTGIINGLMGFILHTTDQGLSLFKRLGFAESSVIRHLYLNL